MKIENYFYVYLFQKCHSFHQQRINRVNSVKHSKLSINCTFSLTGLVIDFELRSKYCHNCKLKESTMDPAAIQLWKTQHVGSGDCCINHTESSKAMESKAAEVLWGRSLAKYNIRYVEMLSDGDSSAHRAVNVLMPYGEKAVQKLDCVNHAHKRMGTALRKLSKDQHLGGRGKGRLTEKKCDSLQNFYRGAIMDNLQFGVEKMRNAIWAGLFHSMSTDEQPRHMQCPQGEESWCFYQKALAREEEPDSHDNHPSHIYLTTEVTHKMIPVYRRMSEESLLRRMIHGGTRNANECLNSTIWVRDPKTSFMGKQRVLGAVSRAVGSFNEGSTELLSVMNRLNISIANISLQLLTKKDEKRMIKADAASTAQAREQRKDYAVRRRLLEREEGGQGAYEAGGH